MSACTSCVWGRGQVWTELNTLELSDCCVRASNLGEFLQRTEAREGVGERGRRNSIGKRLFRWSNLSRAGGVCCARMRKSGAQGRPHCLWDYRCARTEDLRRPLPGFAEGGREEGADRVQESLPVSGARSSSRNGWTEA
ncbi:ribonuclease P protein subunit p14 isoform X1 [Castor canadensis]|uniref:Ribonuclease P protein subunit p14 isoform X1 n=1 Tax=Castor canadensis TaxID=51338 RepID=A0AC58K5S7_CASCN